VSRLGFGGAFDAKFRLAEEAASGLPRARKYPEELLERATRFAFESGRPIAQVGRELEIAPETLRKYVRQVEADEGRRKDLLSSEERGEIKTLRARGSSPAPRQRDPEGRERV
jgi:transposase-like protein